MGTLDPVLADVATQVGISIRNASSLLSTLLSEITQCPGGLLTFLDRLRSAGFSEFVDSCLGSAAPRQISSSALETALGHEWIEKAATPAGLTVSTAASALTFLLPALIQRLTPGGVVPKRIPSDILAYVQRSAATAKLGKQVASKVANQGATKTVAPAWLWPVLLVLALVLVGYWFWSLRRSLKTASMEEQTQTRFGERFQNRR
jgi:uncharacterized protein YidB (DUF937 family)